MLKFTKEGKVLMTVKDSGELEVKDEQLAKAIKEAKDKAQPEAEKPKQ